MIKFIEGLNWVAILGIAIAIETQISNGTMSIAHSFPLTWQPIIKEWAGNLAGIGGLMVTMGSFGQRPAGQFTITPPTVVKILIAAFVVSAFLAVPSAQAQGRKSAVTCLDPLNKLPIGCTPRAVSPSNASPERLLDFLSRPMQDLANFISGDFAGAATLAANGIAGVPDGNGNSCWNMLNSANGIFKEAPPSGPLPGPATVLEQLRLLAITANRVCQNAACTQVFTEAGNALNTVAPINGLPSLTLLCSKVPSVAQVAITTASPPVTPSPALSPVAAPN